MAIFVSLGWQLWGRDWSLGDPSVDPLPGRSSEGAISSLPPSIFCPTAWQAPAPGVPDIMTWYFIDLVWALPLLMLVNINLNIRPRQWPGPLFCGLCGTTIAGLLAYGTSDHLPSDLQNVITSFVLASTGMFVEFYTGLSNVVCIVPALFVFAPGSAALLACVGSFHRDAGDTAYSSRILVTTYVSPSDSMIVWHAWCVIDLNK